LDHFVTVHKTPVATISSNPVFLNLNIPALNFTKIEYLVKYENGPDKQVCPIFLVSGNVTESSNPKLIQWKIYQGWQPQEEQKEEYNMDLIFWHVIEPPILSNNGTLKCSKSTGKKPPKKPDKTLKSSSKQKVSNKVSRLIMLLLAYYCKEACAEL